MTSFVTRQLRLTLILAGTNQRFPGTGNNTLVLTNTRMSAEIEAVARLATTASIKVFNMKAEDMAAASVIWANPPVVLNNIVILEAREGSSASSIAQGWTQVFAGSIKEAQPIYKAQPNVYFQIAAVTGYYQKINPAAPTSYPFSVDIGVAAADIIGRMTDPTSGRPQFTYVDGGATGVLTNPYFYGTLWTQLAQACAAANADFYVQDDKILVVPQGKPRTNVPAVVLNPSSGLLGYPEYSGAGLCVEAIFNPAFLCGTPIQLSSPRVPNATGRWFPIKTRHKLEAVVPEGLWNSSLQCLRVLV